MYSSGLDSAGSAAAADFLDLASPPEQEPRRRSSAYAAGGTRKEEIIPSYDFQPIRTVRSSPPSGHDMYRGSTESNTASSSLKFAGILESHELTKASHEKERAAYDATTVAEIDRTVKKYADNIMHAMDNVSSRLLKMENMSHHLESSVDGLKVAIGNTNGSTDGKLRQLENILREVQTGIQVLRDKQEIAEAQMQLTKLQVSKGDEQTTENSSTGPPAPLPPQQPLAPPPPQLLSVPAPHTPNAPFPPQQNQAPVQFPTPNAPFPPQQNQAPVQFPGQPPQTQIPTVNSYYGPPAPSTDTSNQPYQIPPQQHQPPPQSYLPHPPPPQSYLPHPPPPQSYLPAPQLPQYSHPGQAPQPITPLQSQQSLPRHHSEDSQSLPRHHSEDSPYVPPPLSYPPNIRQLAPSTQPPNDARQRFYGPNNTMYEPPPSRPTSGQLSFSGGYTPPMPQSGFSDSYPYTEPPSHYSGSPVKPSSFSSSTAASGGGSYNRLPTAQILPQAQPAGSSGSNTGNRVPVDDIVDKVSTMGFSRDQVRAAVRKLTENGQSVDLNVVLDKLMNDGEMIQPQKGWFGR